MIKFDLNITSLPKDSPVDYYTQAPDEMEKSLKNGDGGHWVTITKEGPLHGRHIFISDDGRVIGGKGIPKHVVDHLNTKSGKGHLEGATPHKPKEPHEMSMREFRESKPGQHPETTRAQWLNSMIQAVKAQGKSAIPKEVYEAEPWLEPYIDNGFKNPRPKREKLAGEGFPFSKEQNERNNKFLDAANMAFFLVTEGDRVKEMRKVLHKEGYDAALRYIRKYGSHADKPTLERLEKLAEAHKAQGEGLAPGEEKPKRGVKLYHATHAADLNFGEIKNIDNYNRVGSWFTSDPKKARELYGPNVHEAHVELKNPYVVNTDTEDDFYDTFYSPQLVKKHLTKAEQERWGDKEKTKLLNDGEYMAKWKKMMVKSGFDGVTFKNSKIDLNADGSDGTHDVHIAFHPEKQVNNARRMGNDELNKSFREDYVPPLKRGNHALVISRKVAPVQVEGSKPKELGEKHLTLYHVTPEENVASIKQSGLIPRYGKPTQGANPAYNAVYFHTDKKKARSFSVGGKKAILCIKIPINAETASRLRPDEDTFHQRASDAIRAKDGIAYRGTVPPEWIEREPNFDYTKRLEALKSRRTGGES